MDRVQKEISVVENKLKELRKELKMLKKEGKFEFVLQIEAKIEFYKGFLKVLKGENE